MKDFFISYNRADRTWAEWIAWQLESAGYTTVLQAWDFRPGSNFVLDMQKATAEAERTIAVLSPDYVQACFTQPEWAAAFAQDPTGEKGTLLPVRVRECDLTGLLPQVIYIDLVGVDEAAARDALLAGVKRERARPPRPPDFPPTQGTVPPPPSFPGPRSRRRWPFKRGLTPFQPEEANMFLGRDEEREALVARIVEDRLVVVRGLSGCGKSSLLKAGAIPRLRQLGYPIVYVGIQEQEKVTEKILLEVNDKLMAPETRFDAALERLHKQNPDHPPVLVVDQFEKASRDVPDFEKFLQVAADLLNKDEQVIKLVLAERDEWHTILESAVKNRQLNLDVSNPFKVEFLSKDAARQAIVQPLKDASMPYSEDVVEDILSKLLEHGYAPLLKSIQPAELQVVLDLLCSMTEPNYDQAFTWETYRDAGGVEGMLNDYLVRALENSEDTWHLLALFVEEDRPSRPLSEKELTSAPSGTKFKAELQDLLRKGLLQTYKRGKDIYYSLAHDYLVKGIGLYLKKNPPSESLRLARNWLERGVSEYQRHELLLEEQRYLSIYEHRDELDLTDDVSRRLLILTSLDYGHSGIGYWLSRGASLEADLQIVTQKLLSSQPEVQRTARQSLAGCVKPRQDTVTPLGERSRRILHSQVQQTTKSSKSVTDREAIAEALWTLGIFDSPVQRLQVTATVFRHWARDHTLQLVGYAVPILLLVALVVGLIAREKLRGSWELAQSLKAGPTPLVVADPANPETVYVVTQGGPGPREGSSLFMKDGKEWKLQLNNFASGVPTSLSVVRDGAVSRLYATMYYLGVMKSDDQGKKWQLMTTGLPSHGLTSLVADPDSPSTLYVGTSDWRGVLRSTNGAQSWELFDYDKEIYGAAINKLSFTRANGGAVIAGTQDGRILIHRRNTSDWELSFGLPRGSINALVTAKADDRFLYAGTNRGVIIQSSDGGKTWQPWGQISTTFNISAIATAPDDPQRLYASSYGNGGYNIWKSMNGGQEWQPVPGVGLPRNGISSLEVTGRQPYRILAATLDGLFASEDDGTSWSQERLDAPLASVVGLAIGAGHSAPVYAVVGGSVYSNLTGDLKDWRYGKGLQAEIARALAVDSRDPRVAFAGVMLLGESSVFRTRDGGQTWEQTTRPDLEPIPGDTTALALSKTSDGKTILYAGAPGCGVFVTLDEGDSWDTFGRKKCNEPTGENYPSDVSALAVDAGNPDTVYAVVGSRFYRSANRGRGWEKYQSPIDQTIVAMAADPRKAGTVYVIAGAAGFWVTENGGRDWNQRGTEEFRKAEIVAVLAMPEQEGHLFVGASNGSVWETQDGGKSWRDIRGNIQFSSITSIAAKSPTGQVVLSSRSDGIAVFTPGTLFGRVR